MEQILEWGDGCMRGHTVVIGIVEYMQDVVFQVLRIDCVFNVW